MIEKVIIIYIISKKYKDFLHKNRKKFTILANNIWIKISKSIFALLKQIINKLAQLNFILFIIKNIILLSLFGKKFLFAIWIISSNIYWWLK